MTDLEHEIRSLLSRATRCKAVYARATMMCPPYEFCSCRETARAVLALIRDKGLVIAKVRTTDLQPSVWPDEPQ